MQSSFVDAFIHLFSWFRFILHFLQFIIGSVYIWINVNDQVNNTIVRSVHLFILFYFNSFHSNEEPWTIIGESTICHDFIGNSFGRREMGTCKRTSPIFACDRYVYLLENRQQQFMFTNQFSDFQMRKKTSDPNDVESPRNSFVMGNKLHSTQQPAPVSPNAEDLSLILGSMARGRSFSTTVNPKMNEIISPPSNQSQSNLSGKAASVGSIDATSVVRRKKSEPHTAREKYDTFIFEHIHLFFDIVLKRFYSIFTEIQRRRKNFSSK